MKKTNRLENIQIDIFGLINEVIFTGAPLKPIKGTLPSIVVRVNVIASPTYFNLSTAPLTVSLAMSDGVSNGSAKTGPCNIFRKKEEGIDLVKLRIQSNIRFCIENTLPGIISTTIPNACGITRMSEKIIDASRSNLLNGCMVTSHANSGVRQMVKKSFCFRTAYK